jgi:hypothetical protein
MTLDKMLLDSIIGIILFKVLTFISETNKMWILLALFSIFGKLIKFSNLSNHGSNFNLKKIVSMVATEFDKALIQRP